MSSKERRLAGSGSEAPTIATRSDTRVLWLLLINFAFACPALAMPDPHDNPGKFDPPLATKLIQGPGGDEAPDCAIGCTWYSDIMVRETGPRSVNPDPAVVVPYSGNVRPPCSRTVPRNGIKLATSGSAFDNRKGPFLFFSVSDPANVLPFQIMHLPDGKKVYGDDGASGDFQKVSVENGVLHLTYVRAYLGSCSLLTGGAACWRRMAKEGHLAREIAARPAPVAECAKTYPMSKAPRTDESMIIYSAEIIVTGDANLSVLSRGALGCQPAP